jgi:inositol-phosphate phosphatase/L-galactose 1-phosphate phosphatase/histidinol-phosphatase
MDDTTLDQVNTSEIALFIATKAAITAMSYFRQGVEIDLKADDSPVTIADKQIEREVREILKERFPDHEVLGEEYGAGDLTAENVWVVDPIDGTRSFISGHPLFGFLLAHMKSGKCELGMISMPALDEQYVGQKGKGATLNGNAINTSGQKKLSDAILYINEGEKLIETEGKVLKQLLQVGHTKRFGYDCYPHALVASGQIDAVVDYDLKPFDYLPLAGVIEEAGGITTDWDGEPLTYISDGRIVSAATPELHRELISILSTNGKA